MKIYSKIDPETLLHLVVRIDKVSSAEMKFPEDSDIPNLARIDIASEDQFLQLALLHRTRVLGSFERKSQIYFL